MGGQLYQINTAFCYIQLKCSKRVPQPPAPFCTKSSPNVPACTRPSHLARLVPDCTSKSSPDAHFCAAHVCSRRSSYRLDGRGRLPASSKQNFYGSPSRRLALRRCRDKNFIFNLTTVNCQLPPLSNLNQSFFLLCIIYSFYCSQ